MLFCGLPGGSPGPNAIGSGTSLLIAMVIALAFGGLLSCMIVYASSAV